MENIAIVAKLLGSFFYFPLAHENNIQYLDAIKNSDDVNETAFSAFISAIDSTNEESLRADFQLLFEGCEIMPAPPWGSVYLDREQVIFGDSTLRLRQFLASHNMLLDTGMREPEDQFGLTLLALANIIDQCDDVTIVTALLADHFLPWAYHYLTLVQKHGQTDVYKVLAEITQEWLTAVQAELKVTPQTYKLYF
ncbi:MAG: molecular chaperone TorD family protein [Photobacterium frigidiphilum]|uniref:molecular chaperone TorD family protein n=1 Tax=Photobacterium frigidiphilum TaxID=264736 RepID=UPI003002E647